jgi:hypothetical protein
VEDLISPQTYDQVMHVLAPILALMFWIITGSFLWYGLHHRDQRRYLGMLLWTLNVSVFWTLAAYIRLATGYNAPSIAVSVYSVILYLQAAFSMLLALVIFRNEPSPRDTGDPYSSLEVGPDDN